MKQYAVATVALSAALAAPLRALEDRAPAAPATEGGSQAIVIAEVDGRPLTLADALDAFAATHTGHGTLVRGEAALRELAGRLVERDLFLAEAEALGVGEDPDLVAAIEEYRREQVVKEHWKREVDDRAVVSDDEAESFYAKTDVALKLTLIESADRAACERLRARVAAGEDMTVLASAESIAPSRSFGGLLPYVRRGELEPELEPLAFALEAPGALSDVARTVKGFAFVRLEERSVNPTRLPREAALPQIRKILRDRAVDALRAAGEERLVRDGGIELVESALSADVVLEGGDPAAVVARTGSGRTLALSDLRMRLELDKLRQEDSETIAGAARFAARDWALREVICAAAEASGLARDPVIEAKVARRRKDLVMGLLCELYVWPGVEPGEEELRAYYEANKEASFTRPPERRLAYIAVATKAEAEALLARLAKGETFEALAREVSIDRRSAIHGGRIGWIKKGDILSEVEVRAFAMAKGAIEGPIETPQGWFLVHVIDTKDAELVPFAGARGAVLKRLVKERQREAYAVWATRLRERADIRLHEPGIRAAAEWLARQPLPEPGPIDPSSPHARPGEAAAGGAGEQGG